jgi:chromosome segregation ATPase
MVSFRDTEGMRQLSGTRHSGGERAVSTVMYLMALQVLLDLAP